MSILGHDMNGKRHTASARGNVLRIAGSVLFTALFAIDQLLVFALVLSTVFAPVV